MNAEKVICGFQTLVDNFVTDSSCLSGMSFTLIFAGQNQENLLEDENLSGAGA